MFKYHLKFLVWSWCLWANILQCKVNTFFCVQTWEHSNTYVYPWYLRNRGKLSNKRCTSWWLVFLMNVFVLRLAVVHIQCPRIWKRCNLMTFIYLFWNKRLMLKYFPIFRALWYILVYPYCHVVLCGVLIIH